MPTVIIGHDMPPELAADVSTALQGMGVVVKANGVSPQPRTGKVIVVISPKGGSGKTAVSSNLAVALAQRHPGRVVAVDLDVQFGDLGTALSLTPEHTLAQLARTSQIDATTVKLFLTPYEHGLYVLAGANDPVDADSIGHAHVSAVLPLLAQNFDYVVVDTPAGLDERTLAAIECATDLLLVSSLDVTSIRSLRKALDSLDQMGVKAARQFVLNRADAKVGLDPSDAEEAIGMEISCSIPSSRELPLALNLGTPVVDQRAQVGGRQAAPAAGAAVRPHRGRQAKEGVAAMSLTERINQAKQAAAERGEVASKWRHRAEPARDRRRAGRLQGQGARLPVRAPRDPSVRGDQRGPTAVDGDGRDRRPHGRDRDRAVTRGAPASRAGHRPGRDGPRPDRAVPRTTPP